MLPLHGQGTAAVKPLGHRAGCTCYFGAAGNVFVKQSGPIFAEFLPYIYIEYSSLHNKLVYSLY